ncbi:Ig-like domain-containing protein [Antribacter gilvus]|uniref:Ig-like domain-containing protein n=1 Tax=Antribacter gilvus TaxID=2304675 RepID=UPI000F7B1669|nr:Ig-like domain-containing protein [Antribacter gilvus]
MSRVYGNRRSIASTGIVTLFSGAVVGLAFAYDGQATADVDLNDSGVWVTKTSEGRLGRFNYESQALDGTLLAGSSTFDVHQDAQKVLLDDSSTFTASPVDPAHLVIDGTVRMPAGAKIAYGGSTTAILDPEEGLLWVLPFDGAPSFDADETDPTAELGKGGSLVVSRDGTVFVAVPSDGKLYTVKTGSTGVALKDGLSEESLPVGEGDEVEVTAVGDEPVVLDRTAGSLVLPGGDTVELQDAQEARLQQPSATSDVVAVATTAGLVTQPLGGGQATSQRATGVPAQPVQLGGCVYGAWSSSAEVIRDCPETDNDFRETLEGVDGSAVLAYRVNRNIIVLNDVSAGALWLAADTFEKVDDWDLKLPEDAEGEKTESETTTPEQVDQFVADRTKENRPPQPQDDSLGVRPGRTTVLPVLSNDIDPDGDVMTAEVTSAPEGGITVNRVLGGAALQAAVPETASGSVPFTYTVSDGRGGNVAANVTLRVVPLSENNEPIQTGEPVLRVGQGEVATIKVLPYFRDPDGDDLILSSAAATVAGDEVRYRPDGTVEFRDSGSTTGRKIINLSVSDGLGNVIDGRLLVDVLATQEPPVAVQDHVVVLAGQPVTVDPLRNDSDPNGDRLRLVNVSDQSPAVITKNFTAGTFRFVSESPTTYDITYTVSDGPNATMGLVRIDVVSPPDEAGPPVAVSDQVLLPAGGSALVDVLANDTDPAGGVLVVRSVTQPDDGSVTVALLSHRVLRVTEAKRLGDGPVTIRYTVSNGTQSTDGEVRVVPIEVPSKLRPPEAGLDEITVHVGDVVTIPVLKNDSHPDGLELALDDELVETPDPAMGEAFVSEDTVRFRAGDKAGSAYAVYEVADPNGQKDSAHITINVVDGEANEAPSLPDIEERVLAGGTVRVTLPLDGVDPDGDYVMLSGISSAPAKGSVKINEGYIDYTAARSASGVDTFTYTAVDTRGAVAEGTIRVGVAVPPDINQPPVVVDDETAVRPGRTVAVDALENDSDPDGDQIGLLADAFEGAPDLAPKVADERVVVTVPGAEGTHSFYYGVQDAFAARAAGSITIDVAQDAPLLRPIARDDVVPADAVTGSTVTVDALRNDSDPDGVASDLELAVDAATATVDEDGQIVVELTDVPQVIEYTITDMDDLQAKAYLRVPGDPSRMGPHLKPGLAPLEAISGEPLDIDLTQYVVVAEGRSLRITEERKVKTADGTATVNGPTSLTYTSREDFAGGTSVSFEVTDGVGADDAEGRKAVLTLQINVVPPTNLPPVIDGTPLIEVAAGEEAAVDLGRYVTDPEDDALTYAVTGDAEGVVTALAGSTLEAQANPDVRKGSTFPLPFTVTDGNNPPTPGTITVSVVASTRALARANDDSVPGAHQGDQVTVPVLANDSNPFPETPLTLVGGKPIIETGLGEAVYSGDQVSVTPADTFVGVMVVRYRVQDATKDPDREVEGRVQLTVLGKPEAPAKPRVEEVRSETVVLSWDPPNNNGADITGYTVRSSNGYTKECATTTCTLDGLTNNVIYTFTVTATNDVDEGPPSPPSDEARPDNKPEKPAPPTLVFGDSSLTVSWVNQAYTDRSPIECVHLEISPAPDDGRIQKTCVTGSSIVWSGLTNGTAYTVAVQAKNAAPDPSDWSEPSAPETPAAPPAQPAAPTASRVDTAVGGQARVEWITPPNNGDAVKSYALAVFQDGALVRTIANIAGTSQTVDGLDVRQSYTFAVTATNKAGDSPQSARSNAVIPFGTPDPAAAPRAALGSNTSGQANVSWNAIGDFRGTGPRYEVRANSAGARGVGNVTSYTYTGLNNGTSYSFQVRACNDHACSAWSASSNAVTPFTVPSAPSVTWARAGTNSGGFTVRGPGDSGGRAVQRIEWEFTQGDNRSGSRQDWPFTIDVGNAYDRTYGLRARACNEAGCGPYGSDTGTTAAAPNPRAWVTHGDSAVGRPGCNDPSCAWFYVNYSDFPGGAHTVECQGDNGGWHNITGGTYQHTFGGNGGFQTRCYYGYSNNNVRVVIDGVAYEARGW